MALTRITKGVIKPNENYDTHNINSTGIITATKFVGTIETSNATITGGSITATTGTFSGNVSIGGTLTYEDVTNIDSVGIITARGGIVAQDDVTFTSANGNNILFDKSDNLLRFGDNVIAHYGSDNDLVMHHTGATGYIKNTTGTLYIQDDSNVIIGTLTNSHTGMKFHGGGALELYHNNNLKFTTKSTGAEINYKLSLGGAAGSPGILELYEGGAVSEIRVTRNSDANSDLQFKTEMGDGTQVRAKIDYSGNFVVPAGKIGIGTDNAGRALTIRNAEPRIRLIDDDTGSFSEIYTDNSGHLYLNADQGQSNGGSRIIFNVDNDEKVRITSDGRVGINQTTPAVELDIKASSPEIRLTCSDNNLDQGDTIGQLGWYTTDPTTPGGAGTVSYINTFSANGNGADYSTKIFNRDGSGGGSTSIQLGNAAGSITFGTNTAGNAATTRLIIDSAGKLLVAGATNDGMAFSGGDDLIIGTNTSGTRTGMTLVSHSGQDGGVYFSRGTSSNSDYVKGQLVYNHPNDYFAIYTGGSGIRLKIDGLGGHNFYNNNAYAAANLAECNADKVAINIRQTRSGQTKAIAIGAIGTNSQTGLQAYDSSNNSANNFVLNPYGGYLGIGLGAGNDPDELLQIRSGTNTAPIFEIVHDVGGTAYKGQIGMRGNDLEIRGSSGQMEFYTGNVDGASSTERFRIKDDGRIGIHNGVHVPLTQLHILDYSHSSWDAALTKSRAVLRLETDWNAGGHQRAIGDYGSGIVFNHLGGHSTAHNDDSHAWLGLRIWDTPGYERSSLVFATNDITGSESTHDAGLKERMSITPHGHVVINNPTNNQMTSSSHAKLWVEANGINLATEYNVGDNEGSQPHFTLAGQNSHVRLDMGTMDVNPYGGYIQARYDNAPDLGATDNDGLEPLMLQPRGGPVTFNFGASTTMPANFDSDSPYGMIRMRAGTADSTSVGEANTAIKIWPAQTRVHTGQKGEQDQGTKYGGISWLVMDGQSNSGWAAYDGNQCWMGMSLHSTPGQELGNWQLRMNNSGNANSHANNIALQASPQGWVTKPCLPAFHVGSPNVAGGSAGAAWRCHANSLWLNRGSHYDNSNGRFTAPINGLYYFFFWGMSSSGHNGTVDVYSRLDGSRDQIGTAYESNGNSSGGYHQFTAQFVRSLNKNQYVDIYTSNGSLYNGTDGRHGGWGGWLIG